MANVNLDLDHDLSQTLDQGNSHLQYLQKDHYLDHPQRNLRCHVQSQGHHQVRDTHQSLDHVRDLGQENQCQDQNQDRSPDQYLGHAKDHSLQLQGEVLGQGLVLGHLAPARKHLFLGRVLDRVQNRDLDQSQNLPQDPLQVHHQDHVQDHVRDRVHHHAHDQDQCQLPDLDIHLGLNQDQDLVQHQSLGDQEVEVKIQEVLLEREIEFYPILRKKRMVLKQQKNQNMK